MTGTERKEETNGFAEKKKVLFHKQVENAHISMN